MDLDISFLDKMMTTPVYVKMDAHEPLLLSEGVCRHMGIKSYHPEVKPRKASSFEPVLTPDSDEQSTTFRVPTVRVQLIQSVKLPPNQALMAEVRLSDDAVGNGPMLLEPNLSLCHDRSVQIAESIIIPSADGVAKVMLTIIAWECLRELR